MQAGWQEFTSGYVWTQTASCMSIKGTGGQLISRENKAEKEFKPGDGWWEYELFFCAFVYVPAFVAG